MLVTNRLLHILSGQGRLRTAVRDRAWEQLIAWVDVARLSIPPSYPAPAAQPAAVRAYAVVVAKRQKATVADVHAIAATMPHTTVERGPLGNAVYQVGRKTFVFFRNPRPDAFDPETGERYDDVIVIWVESDADKQALVQDQTSPFFTTPHFNGHLSVLVRASRLGELNRDELAEVVQDAWLSRASRARAKAWLATSRAPARGGS